MGMTRTIDYIDVNITERIHNGADCYPWRKVFAWWPVKTVGGRYVWLRKIYKRKFWVIWGRGFHMEPEVEYAELFEIIKYDNERSPLGNS
jgi:hypothetical protein